MDYRMEAETPPTALVGMDAHSVSVSLCVTRWRRGYDPIVTRELTTDLKGLESTYAKRVPAGALTVLEASTNAFAIARRLEAAGHRVKVLASNTVAGMSRRDRVNDRLDARNLAAAYASGKVREVHVPDRAHARLRELWFGYRDAVKDTVRWSNRLWGFCSMRGLELPKRSPSQKVDGIRLALGGKAWEGGDDFRAGMMLNEYAHALGTRDTYARKIDETVAADPRMARLMQVLGIRCVTAFALVAFIGDVRRFASAKKLVSYVGLNPCVGTSGEMEGPRRLSDCGRRDLKSLMAEAAQCALTKGNAPMHIWARRKIASGKERNKIVCALARKMLCHAWHILMGHPPPSAEPDAPFRRKLARLASRVGKEGRARLGHASAAAFVESVCATLRPQAEGEGEAPPSRPPACDEARRRAPPAEFTTEIIFST